MRGFARTRLAAFAALLLIPLALWVGLPLASTAAPSVDQVQSRLDRQRSAESSLSSQASAFGRIADQLAGDVALLQRRRAQVQAELNQRRVELDRARAALRRERRRLKALRTRLKHSRRVLGRRLVEVYKSGKPDLITVILTSNGFADLLERKEFLRRINDQDTRIIEAVRRARDAARLETIRLSRLERRAKLAADTVAARLVLVARLADRLAAKQAALRQAQQARLSALSATRAQRRKLEGQLEKLQAEQNSSTATSGSFGNWAIPWSIVECESGGVNHPPNWAGASGYYQIIPSTWSGFGGHGPAAWLAPKSEQDRVATLIWNGGAGAGNWDCASIVHYGGM